MLFRMAARNLMRHRWRTYLTIGGISVSTAVLIALLALFNGIYGQLAEATTSVELGQIQIQSEEYVDRASIHHHFRAPAQLLDHIEATDGVHAASPRVISHGLVGEEEQSRIARVKGVDPHRETEVTILDEAIVDGQWLTDERPDDFEPRQIILGSVMAQSLQAELGDELVVLTQAVDGSLGNELVEVTGIVHTGNILIDRQTAYMHIDDLRFIAALDDEVHEIALATALDDAPHIARGLQSELIQFAGDDDLVVRPWQEIAVDIYTMVELAAQVSWWLLFIIFAIAALGIFNTLRMSTLERSREFGVMMGVGLSRTRLLILIVIEGVILGTSGALLGGLLGAAIAYLSGTYGLSLEFFTDAETLQLMGVAFADRIFYDLTAREVLMPVVGIIIVTALCATWPALRALRENPRDTIAGR